MTAKASSSTKLLKQPRTSRFSSKPMISSEDDARMDDDWEMDGSGGVGGEDGRVRDKRKAKEMSTFTAVPACGQCVKKNVECMITV